MLARIRRRLISWRTVADLQLIGSSDPRWEPAVRRYTRFLSPAMKRFGEPYYWAAFAYAGG